MYLYMYIDRCIYLYSLCEHNLHRFVMSTYIYTHIFITYVHIQKKHINTIHTEIYIALNIYIFAHLRAQLAPIPHVYIDIYMYSYTSRHRCIYTYGHRYVYTKMYTHMHIYRNIYTYIYTYIHLNMCTSTRIKKYTQYTHVYI